MIKHNWFTLVELAIVVVIVCLLVGMLLSVLSKARAKAHAVRFDRAYPGEIPMEKLVSIASGALGNAQTLEEFDRVIAGKLKLDDARQLQVFRKRVAVAVPAAEPPKEATGDLYERWCQFTGNPRSWTRQEFEALAAQEQIAELRFSQWLVLTGNPKGFTEAQFNALKAKGLVPFPVKKP